jgi:3-methyladenine DNA glycosylase AlkD
MDMPTLKQAQSAIRKRQDKVKAEFLKRFFKTGPGDYAAGDNFLGLTVPLTRSIAKDFYDLSIKDVFLLLQSKFHEERLLALFILDVQFKKASGPVRGQIVKQYLKLAPKYVNNWDLVDSSAHLLVGKYLEDKPREILSKLARSKNLWEKRIAIISTFHFIRKNDFQDTLKISETLLDDDHDLIHKAVGWMLREVGNRSMPTEIKFLNKHAHRMPRTMLRYAIEKFPEGLRKKYLAVKYAKKSA